MSDEELATTDSQTPAPDDVKAKMKEALDRKHAQERAGEAHLSGPPKAEHTHGKSGGPQRFQRKSG